MKTKTTTFIIACFTLLAVFSGCKKDKDDVSIITMTTAKEGIVHIYMADSGDFTIDWGDGSEIETHTLQDYSDKWYSSSENFWIHNYSNTSSRTITITGRNITHLLCSVIQLTSLDVSRNTKLIRLGLCQNRGVKSNITHI